MTDGDGVSLEISEGLFFADELLGMMEIGGNEIEEIVLFKPGIA